MTSGSPGPLVSVVVPARDAEVTLGDCLRALANQSLARESYEVLVVVDHESADGSAQMARAAGVGVLASDQTGAAAARNAGIAAARGEWIAFTDADCIPSRTWLSQLLRAVQTAQPAPALGAAGATLGYESTTPAARFVDLSGGLHAERHLAHERFPWAPTGNVMYRRAALVAVGGFDARFLTYEGCDLHTRLLREVGGECVYVPQAVVMHRHRAGWRAYWRQQLGYGIGYGQFFRRYEAEIGWSAAKELRAWLGVLGGLGRALLVHGADDGLVARGSAIKALAQRIGFMRGFWSPTQARRMRGPATAAIRPAS